MQDDARQVVSGMTFEQECVACAQILPNGVRGFFAAYNISDGSLAWKAFSTGPDDEMLLDPENTTHLLQPIGADSSLNSWEGEQWKIGGGTTWGWFTYDPDVNLVYYRTGNPGTWNPTLRAEGPCTVDASVTVEVGPNLSGIVNRKKADTVCVNCRTNCSLRCPTR